MARVGKRENYPKWPPSLSKPGFLKNFAKFHAKIIFLYAPPMPRGPNPNRVKEKDKIRKRKNPKTTFTTVDPEIFGNAAVGKQREDRALTEKQQRFVNAIARDNLNLTAAARVAGYDRNPASMVNGQGGGNLMKNPKIIKAIAEEREKWAQASNMTKKKVIDGILEAIGMAKIQADPTPMIQGWTQIAKMCGFMEPTKHKLEVSVNGQVVIQKLQQLDDEQLLALADGRADALEGKFTVIE